MSRKLHLFLLMLALTACSDPAPQESAVIATPAPAAADPSLSQRVEQLAKAVEYAEDISAIKRLQKSYGYYLDKGLWTDLAEYFALEARG